MQKNTTLDSLFNEEPAKNYDITFIHHVIFWAVYFILNTLRWSSIHNDFVYSLKTNFLGFPIHMALSYFNVYYLMPRFIYKRKYVTYTLLVIAALLVMLVLKYNLTYYLVSTNVWPEGPVVTDQLTFNYSINTMMGELYVVSFVTAIKITVDWLRENRKLHDLEKRQLTTELKFLKSQISPHFFFNTLNNIYSLTLEKSDKAPEVVLKLSELMRYLLYATKKKRQDLTREIDCIQNYIELERIRFDDSLQVEINISGDLENHSIAPMLLIPLVENCFKHGANKSIEQKIITIDIEVNDDFLTFQIANSIPTQKPEKSLEEIEEGGIGLSNVKKRLELGYNKNDYDLAIFEKDHMFYVTLKLKV